MDRPRWKLLVEGLGKIERAEVDVRPLMLFVGDNNSGKSYLASLLWGLVATQLTLPMPAGDALRLRGMAHATEGGARAPPHVRALHGRSCSFCAALQRAHPRGA